MKRFFTGLTPALAPKLALPAPKLIEIKTHLPWWGYVLLGVGVALAFSLIFCIFLVRKKSKTHSQEKGSDRIWDSHRFFLTARKGNIRKPSLAARLVRLV